MQFAIIAALGALSAHAVVNDETVEVWEEIACEYFTAETDSNMRDGWECTDGSKCVNWFDKNGVYCNALCAPSGYDANGNWCGDDDFNMKKKTQSNDDEADAAVEDALNDIFGGFSDMFAGLGPTELVDEACYNDSERLASD